MDKTIFITPLPAFYKVNLYNEIAKKKDISAWFLGNGTIENRSSDFVSAEMNFDHYFINKGSFQNRNKLISCFRLIKMLIIQNNKEVIIGGWDTIEFWIAIFLLSRNKLSLVLESSSIESVSTGIKGLIKKFFLKRVSKVYASGNSHIKLLKSLNFKGEINLTKGVGLINYNQKIKSLEKYQGNFLYVGRLSKVKNLIFLIKVFNRLPNLKLTLIGTGPEEDNLKLISKDNIDFLGSINNKELPKNFSENNFLILPSYSETWGLVVEEALYNGVPIIISKNCGSVDLIEDNINGFIFNPFNKQELLNILSDITNEKYQSIKSNISIDFIESKDEKQIKSYLD